MFELITITVVAHDLPCLLRKAYNAAVGNLKHSLVASVNKLVVMNRAVHTDKINREMPSTL